MGQFLAESFVFYSKEKSRLEDLRSYLNSLIKPCEDKAYNPEVEKTETKNGKVLSGYLANISEITVAKKSEDGFEFWFGCEQWSHSNVAALEEFAADYEVDICYRSVGEYNNFIYDPKGRYWKRNFDNYVFRQPKVFILFERIAASENKTNANCIEKLKNETNDYCDEIATFLNCYNIKHEIAIQDENKFHIELKDFKLGNPWISPNLEDIKTGLSSLNFAIRSNWLQAPFKSSVYFRIDSGAGWFSEKCTVGTLERAEYEFEFNYAGHIEEWLDLTNDKDGLFFKINKYTTILDCEISSYPKDI